MSDALADGGAMIDYYLNNPQYDDIYCGELGDRIVKLRAEMAEIQRILDTPPSQLDENFNDIRPIPPNFPKRDWVVWCGGYKIGRVQAVVHVDAVKEAQAKFPDKGELVVLALPRSM